MKLEDLVKEQNNIINTYFNEYDLIMEEIESSIEIDDVKIKKLDKVATELFNYMESCPSALDAAKEHESSEKMTQLNNLSGLFYDALKVTIPSHYAMMTEYYGYSLSPSNHAFYCMQELIVQTKSKDEVKALFDVCKKNNIPTKGLEVKRRFKMTKNTERILSIILGIASIILMTILLINIDEPSPKKYHLFTVLISILSGLSAALFTGTLNLNTNTIKAKSGAAAFIIVFFILQGVHIFN